MDARQQQARIAETLRRAVRLALEDPSENWAQAPTQRALVAADGVSREMFERPLSSEARSAIRDTVQTMLEAANREREDREAQAGEIALALASYVAAAAMDANTGQGWIKVWNSVDDDRTRTSHRAANGQRVSADKPFSVGGHEMSGPHDVTAPIEEWAGCRCWASYEREGQAPDALVAAATDDLDIENAPVVDLTAFVIVALPAEADPVNAIVGTEDPAHVTLLYLSADYLEQASQIIAGEAPKYEPGPVSVTERGTLGDDEADVLFVEPGDLAGIRAALLEYEPIRQGFDEVEQFDEWTPHLTVGYPQTPAAEGEVPSTIMIDRIAILHDGMRDAYTLGEAMADEETTETAPPPTVERTGDEFASTNEVYGYDEVPLYGVLAPEGVPTGDGRHFATDSLTWIEPPLSLRWQKVDQPGHDGSVVTGRIDRIWREDGLVKFEGGAVMSTEADEMVGLIAERALRGISVDLDGPPKIELRMADGSPVDIEAVMAAFEEDPDAEFDIVESVVSGRIRSAAVCAIPAFPEAFVAIGTWADHGTEVEVPEGVEFEEPTPQTMVASAATILAFAPGTEDGPGWLTHPVDTDRLRDYWVRGEGAAKIGWGAPGDFNRCRVNLAPYVKPQHLAGYCANRHKDALGIWPGEHSGGSLAASAATAPEQMFHELLASGTEQWPSAPSDWFTDPGFREPSSFTVTKQGRVYGHIAAWNVCHTAFDECVLAPRTSPSNYFNFMTGMYLTSDDVPIPVGQITIGTGHAHERASARATAAHYDNTGTAVADITVGTDEFGIWCAGAVRPWATERQVKELRAAALSGDWRGGRGRPLDLIAVLAVNAPGFPTPKVALAASAAAGQDDRVSLVAAGVVPQREPQETKTIEQVVAEALHAREAVAAVRDDVTARYRARLAAIKAEIGAR